MLLHMDQLVYTLVQALSLLCLAFSYKHSDSYDVIWPLQLLDPGGVLLW